MENRETLQWEHKLITAYTKNSTDINQKTENGTTV